MEELGQVQEPMGLALHRVPDTQDAWPANGRMHSLSVRYTIENYMLNEKCQFLNFYGIWPGMSLGANATKNP